VLGKETLSTVCDCSVTKLESKFTPADIDKKENEAATTKIIEECAMAALN